MREGEDKGVADVERVKPADGGRRKTNGIAVGDGVAGEVVKSVCIIDRRRGLPVVGAEIEEKASSRVQSILGGVAGRSQGGDELDLCDDAESPPPGSWTFLL